MNAEVSPRRTGLLKGFTLVELLVVIGIIALLISILLPVLGSAREKANAVSCLANQRSIVQAALIYVNDNDQTMPLGHWNYDTSGSPSANEQNGVGFDFDGWATVYTLTSAAVNPAIPGGGMLIPNEMEVYGGSDIQYDDFDDAIGEMWKCPSVGEEITEQPAHYGYNSIVFVSREMEVNGSAIAAGADPSNAIRSTKVVQLEADNALTWDTPVFAAGDASSIYFTYTDNYIDFYAFADPANPFTRYRGEADPEDAFEGDGFSITHLAPGVLVHPDGNDLANSELSPNAPFYIFPWNNIRFRHGNELKANVSFSDGSVQSKTWSPKNLHEAGDDFSTSDITRRELRIQAHTNGFAAFNAN